MTQEQDLPPLPWASTREARRAERAERRRERHAGQEARTDTRRARPQIGPEVIVDAAVRILDTEGYEALTIRHLASELGTGVMTLYWHVRNKDEVLDLVADRVMGEFRVAPAGGDWRARVRDLAESVRTVLLRHPAAVALVDQRPMLGANALRLVEAALGIFRDAGFSDADAAYAYFTVSNYVVGFCAWQTANVRVASRPELERREIATMMLEYAAKLPADRYPNLVATAPQMFGGGLDERFAFGLDCLVDGLAARLEKSGADSRQARGARSDETTAEG